MLVAAVAFSFALSLARAQDFLAPAGLIGNETYDALGNRRGFSDCTRCHKAFGSKNKDRLHTAIKKGGCLACHIKPHNKEGRNEKWLRLPPDKLCVSCHSGAGFAKNHVHPPAARSCISCHDPHVSPSEKLLKSKLPYLCYDFHDHAPFFKKVRHPPVAGGACTDCHSPHSSDERHLLVSKTVCFSCHDENDFSGKRTVHPPVAAKKCVT